MLNIILFDSDARNNLLPLTATRPVGELRIGILTLREKWERRMKASVSYITQEYLQVKYPIRFEADNLIVNSSVLPDDAICARIEALKMNEALLNKEGDLIAARISEHQIESLIADEEIKELSGITIENEDKLRCLTRLWHFSDYNEQELLADFTLLTQGKKSNPISSTNRILGYSNVFLEEGVSMEYCTLNATKGPIYIGKNVEIMEGCILRGPISIGENSILKMGAKVYGPSTFGPGCRVGGEVARSIFYANSNKAHDGYLGDSILGEWCNLGADTNNSNLKNNYGEVKLWDYVSEKFEKTGKNFMGLVMGDHSKCAINTMFNTGTVIGVFTNVYGAGFPRNFVPDFSWGGAEGGYRTYKFAEACETATIVMARRNVVFNELDKSILFHIYDKSTKFRSWEK
jgi:UDP-N-acetylglucosamine diphosphorylase/glucosamine-1-phosphate N-acetyltransferase